MAGADTVARAPVQPGGPADPAAEAVEDAVMRARTLDEIVQAAAAIRTCATAALDRGDDALAVTQRVSRLNDRVTDAVVRHVADATGCDLDRACWLVFGSQARGEQTLVTDQDNGLVFASDDPQADRARWMAFGARVNHALDACGYALCRGGLMASQPLCCLTADEWCARFDHWMAHGSGNDLLAARIFFDVRPLAGNAALAQPVTARLQSKAASVPRFLKQMADVALCNHVPLDWLGRFVLQRRAQGPCLDLKMSGTALFVDAARLWALAFAIPATATVARLEAAAGALRVPAREVADWTGAFATLLRLRMRVQAGLGAGAHADADGANTLDPGRLDPADRRDLKRALRAAQWVQQRVALDYRR